MSSLSRKLMGTTAAVATDEFFNQTTLLLHGDGTSGGQNNTFLDGSTNNFTITRNGNTTQGSFNPYGDRWSNYFDGTGDYLYTGGNVSIGTSAFTLEAWIYPSSVINRAVASLNGGSTNRFYFGTLSTSTLLFRYTGTSDISGGTLVPDQWNHVAVVREGTGTNQTKIYLNGVNTATGTVATNYATDAINIGTGRTRGVNDTQGFLSDVRLVIGTAVYTSAFTPPTAPLTAISGTSLLTCQSNGFKDNSSNNFAITRNGDVKVTTFSPYAPSAAYNPAVDGGSGYFDGTGDFLAFANDTAFDFGAGDFTVECWLYRVGTGSGTQVYESVIGGNQSTLSYWNLYVNSSNNQIVWFGNDSVLRSTSTSITNNSWNHVVATRSGSTLKIFINGVEGYSATVTTSYSLGSSGGRIGFDGPNGVSTGNRHFFGYISGLVVDKGTGYTSVTVPTAPPDPTGKDLLCNFTNAGIFDSTAKNVLETVGNAQIDTAVKKYGTGSMEFDGTGDYLVMPITQDLQFGSGDFTIEGWINVPSVDATYRCILSIGPPVQIYARSGTIEVYFNDGDNTSTYIVNGTTGPASAISVDTWAHFAVVRNGTTFTVYVDGVAGVAATGVSAAVAASATRPAIGIYLASSLYPYTGYIDDFRITKGVARYTAAFTPPDRAFPDQ